MKIIVNSFPKSGTHLIAKYLELINFEHAGIFTPKKYIPHNIIQRITKNKYHDREGVLIGVNTTVKIRREIVENRIDSIMDNQFILSHINYSNEFIDILKKTQIKCIVMIRDPRAIIVSLINHIKKNRKHTWHKHFKKLPLTKCIRELIEGSSIVQENLIDQFSRFAEYKMQDNLIFIKFEDIIGSQGGGSNEVSFEFLRHLNNFLEIDINDDDLKNIIENKLFGGTDTFRKGQISSWRTELNEIDVNYLNDRLTNVISVLDYKL